MSQNLELITAVTRAVEDFNNSPWIDLGEPMNVRDCIIRAEENGLAIVLEEIRRADIRLAHKEEAMNGMI